MTNDEIKQLAIECGLNVGSNISGTVLVTSTFDGYMHAHVSLAELAAYTKAVEELIKVNIKIMHTAKFKASEQGVTFGYEPNLQDYLDAL